MLCGSKNIHKVDNHFVSFFLSFILKVVFVSHGYKFLKETKKKSSLYLQIFLFYMTFVGIDSCSILPLGLSLFTVDPNYPCRPNQNGVFFHHPFLCNKYIWCVQGEEIVQHCPIGTLYIDSGQCTFDADQSRCYKTETSKLLA